MPTKSTLKPILYLIEFLIIAPVCLHLSSNVSAAPSIVNLTDNREDYVEANLPSYSKFEIKFNLTDTAYTNPYFPYDPAPPPGVIPEEGISVEAKFLPPGLTDWQRAINIPGFYYQDYDDRLVNNREWYYPTGTYTWKVRFSPNQTGIWQYRLFIQDKGGTIQSQTYQLEVIHSDNKGFIKVSSHDSRYFVFDDGSYFPGLGYNMNYSQVDWVNPILSNQENFTKMKENGIQFTRIWLSQWGIYGSSYNPWKSIDPWWTSNLTYKAPGLTRISDNQGDSELVMKVSTDGPSFPDQCLFLGWNSGAPALKRNTNYNVRLRYKVESMSGPAYDGFNDYGFVVKTGGWLWGSNESQRCYYPGTGTILSPYINRVDGLWYTLDFAYNSGNQDFLPYFYLTLENVTQGKVYIDSIEMWEWDGINYQGPNILSKPDMDHHRYIDQRNAYAFDKALTLAEQNGIYFKTVIHEKHDWVLNSIDYAGNWTAPTSDNRYFYGNWREMTRVRWYQTAWWRYLQARWGYSPSIHSWELVNEGDPYNGLHYSLADEMAKYMHQFGPNNHLATTSTWQSFPIRQFWNNSNYPHIDYADVHFYAHQDSARSLRADRDVDCCQYIPILSDTDFYDSVSMVINLSREIGAYQPFGVNKPVIRGEFGLWGLNYSRYDAITNDTQAVWLHNFVWAQINSGGMYDASYWWPNAHIYLRNSNGTYQFDHRDKFKPFYLFIKDVPLGNGNYTDAEANASHQDLRVLGQKDVTNGRLHLWVQNRHHTWKNVVDNVGYAPLTGTITVAGFEANATFPLEWWDPYTGLISQTETVTSNSSGQIILPVNNLDTDIAIRIGTYPTLSSHPATLSDLDHDQDVDFSDYSLFLPSFDSLFSIFDFNKLVSWFGSLINHAN